MPSGSVCRSMTRYPAYAEHSLEQMCRSTHGCSSNKAFAQHIRQATHARRAQRARNSACAQGDGHLKSRRRSCWPGNAHGALTSRSAVTPFSGCFAIVKTRAFLSPNAYRGNRHGVIKSCSENTFFNSKTQILTSRFFIGLWRLCGQSESALLAFRTDGDV